MHGPYFMITNRNTLPLRRGFLGSDTAPTTYWIAGNPAGTTPVDVTDPKVWTQHQREPFYKILQTIAQRFPLIKSLEHHESQKHISLFVHGYNNDWVDAAKRYQSLCSNIFDGDEGMGVCILYTWPSYGSEAAYLPDRDEARASAPALADVLIEAYDRAIAVQESVGRALRMKLLHAEGRPAPAPLNACRAKTSIIAHSMGNFVVQKALARAWTNRNRPQLTSLVNQLIMVAADVDNDLFGSGETQDTADGTAVSNLTYRITSLYSGMDSVLGLSAGVKHFGKRRLGRSGIDRAYPVPDNIWQVDCSPWFQGYRDSIHSAYFEIPDTLNLIRSILRGTDRGQLDLPR